MVAEVSGEVVGVCLLTTEGCTHGHVASIRETFDIDPYWSPSHVATSSQGHRPSSVSTNPAANVSKGVCVLSQFVVSSAFTSCARDLLRHSLRLHDRASTLLFRLRPSDSALTSHGDAGVEVSVPSCIDDFVQLTPRNILQLRPQELPVMFKPNGTPHHITASQMDEVRFTCLFVAGALCARCVPVVCPLCARCVPVACVV
jgi:hypothetical protein